MSTPRLRMVAGPNGSGKTTLVGIMRQRIPLGIELNPDELEAAMKKTGALDMAAWGLRITQRNLDAFLRQHPLGGAKFANRVKTHAGQIFVPSRFAGGYVSAMLCDLMRRRWISKRVSFTFETVMSSPDKIELLQEARRRGYRTYLYYVCTESAAISAGRVSSRVRQGGHAVPRDKIVSRYARSLLQLRAAIALCNRAYLFDNSGPRLRLIAEFEDSKCVRSIQTLPAWADHAGFEI